MAIKIKSTSDIAKKYATRAGQAGQAYQDGVNSPRTDWAQSTEASAGSYATGVNQSIANNSFQKGVAKAGTAKWQRKAAGVGAQRYPQGAQAAQGDYATGFDPYAQVIAGMSLPPRGPKGDPGNINRVAALAQALRQKKLAG
jgi:hypothetical protein